MKRWFIGLAAALILAGGWAIAQVPALFIASPTGLEQINVLNAGSNIATITVNQIRNSEGYILVAAGTTVATTIPNAASLAITTGAITTWNVVLPTSPFDGQMVKLSCPGGNVGTVAVTATLPTGVTIVQGAAFTACTAASNNDAVWHYAISNNVWYRTE